VATHRVSVKVGANITEAQREFNKLSRSMKRLGRDMSDWGRTLTTRMTLPLVGLGATFVKVASDAEETNSKFRAVFKDQANEVEQWAKTYAREVGRSVHENKAFLASIQDTLVPLGMARDRAAEMSKTVVELATDLGSFNNLPTEQVIMDVQSAIVGNTETLRKYGVVANQAQIEQEALTSGLVKTKEEITPLVKAQAILQLAIKGTTDAQGDARRTSGQFANQMRALKAASKDLAADLGQELMPVAQDLVKWLRSGVDWFSDLSDETQKTILKMAGFAAAIGPVLLVGGKLVGTLSKIVKAFGPVIAAANLSKLQFLSVAGAIGALLYMLHDFYTQSERVQKQIRKTYSVLGTGGGLSQDIQDHVEGFYEDPWEGAEQKSKDAIDEIRKEGEKLAEDLAEEFGKIGDSLAGGINEAADAAMGKGTEPPAPDATPEPPARKDFRLPPLSRLDEDPRFILYEDYGLGSARYQDRYGTGGTGYDRQAFKQSEWDWEELQKAAEIGRQIAAEMGKAEDVTTETADAFGDLATKADLWTKSLSDGIADAIINGRSLLDVLQQIGRQIAKWFLSKAIGSLFGIPLQHAGGIFGVDPPSGIRKFHTGGVVGANEQLAVLEKGEGVFTPAQMRALGKGGENVHVSMNINAVDARSFVDLIERNPEAIEGLVVQAIRRNKPLRGAIQGAF
jgi:hypothetical protein